MKRRYWLFGPPVPVFLMMAMTVSEETPLAAELADASCSTFYNEDVKYVEEEATVPVHSSWSGAVIYDPTVIEYVTPVGEEEVTGDPHNEWQDHHVPKVNHYSCLEFSGAAQVGSAHH